MLTLHRSGSIRKLRPFLGLVVSGMALYFAVRGVDFRQAWMVLQHADWLFIVLALLSVVLNILFKAFRWWVLLGKVREQVGFQHVLAALVSGQLLNMVFPVRAGDIHRVLVMDEAGRTFVLGTIVLEKWVDTLAYALVIFMTVLLIPVPAWMAESAIGVMVAAGIAFVLLVIAVFHRETLGEQLPKFAGRLPGRLRDWLQPRISTGLSSLGVFQGQVNVFWIGVWTFGAWATAVLNNALVFRALEIDLPFTAPLVLLVAVQAGISLVAVPATIGVFEYICVVTLLFYGLEQEVALGYGILLHGVVLLPIIVGGMVSLIGLSTRATRSDQA